MAFVHGTHKLREFGKQSRRQGWSAWVLVSLFCSFLFSAPGFAGTFAPAQTTFSTVAVGQTSAPLVVSLTAVASGTAGAPTTVTEGVSAAATAEFAITDPGTCGSSPNLSQGQSCSVSVAFSPRFPGVRHGAVVLETAGGQLLASTLMSGVGQGGLPVLIPGEIDTVAGDGQWFYQGDGVPATQAPIYLPSGLAVDGAGNLFLADTINNRVRRVDAVTHIITTYAGTGNPGHNGDGNAATSADITNPGGLALDGAGNLFIADTGNHAIRRVDAVTNIISTVAGTLGQSGTVTSGAAAVGNLLNAPQGIALSPNGDLVIADTGNNQIQVVTFSDGVLTTVAGTGVAGYNGDNILATTAQLNSPTGVALRGDGAIAVADLSSNRVRLFTVGGNIATIAGTTVQGSNNNGGYTGDGGPATAAELQGPASVAFDPAGDLLIADSVNNCVRLVYGPQSTITTLTGIPTDDRYAGDSGPDNAARMHGPNNIVFDAGGNLWISDRFNNRVREVYGSLLTIGPYPTMKVGKTSPPVAEQMLNAGNQPLTLATPTLQQAKLDSTTTTCGQASLNPAVFCQMGVEFAPQNVGSNISGSVTWNSDAPNVTPVDQLYGQVLSVEPTSVALTASADPGLVSQPLTLTATVTSDDTGRTGTVDFVEGGTTYCSAIALGADGTASCQIAGLSMGTHTLEANYSGDNNNAASQGTLLETIKQQAALALGVSSSPATVTSNVVLTVNAADASGTPTGTVIFYDGSAALATVSLDASGNASWSSTSFAVGTHSISAQYSGDASNVPGTTVVKALVINQAGTITVLNSANNDATVGSNVVLTANVVSNNGPAPTGSVQFLDGATVLGAPALNNGSASITVGNLTPGSHTLTAVYSGDTNDATSTSTAINQVIEQIGTATTLGADVDPANAGAAVTLTAIVSMAPGATADGALAGTITFHDGSTVLGSAAINATGQAVLTTRTLSVGSHRVVATYNGATNYAISDSAPLNEIVQQTPTAVTLSSASAATLMGKPASFSSTVTSTTGVPTGTVTFKDGSAVLGTSPIDAHGTAVLSLVTLNVGTHSVVATYNGDANYLSAVSTPVQQTVSLAPATVSLSGPTNVVDAGTTTQFIVGLATPGLTPTGTLTLLDGSLALGTEPVSTTGTFTFSTTRLSVGTHIITASYSGDVNNAAASSADVTVAVRQAPTTTSLQPSTNPLTQGDELTLTAATTSDSPGVGGTVTFLDGTAVLGSVALGANGTATFQTATSALGTHSLTAVYSGDTNHAGSTSVVVPELVVQSSSLALNSSENPAISGHNVTFTGQITGSPIPTGTAIFRDNGAVLGTVALNSVGMASFSTTSLSVGAHTITFTYSGDTNFATATTQITQTVLNATTQATLSASANPATYGQALNLTAVVGSNGGAATGRVIFSSDGAVIGSAPLDASGTAVLTLSSLSPGDHVIVASYPGDGKANSSDAKPVPVTVKQVTSLAISTDANPTQTLTPIKVIATVISPGAAVATGSVTFVDNGVTALGTAVLGADGRATLSLPELSAGTHAITASYPGDGSNFGSQSAAYNQLVQLRPTQTTVTGTNTDSADPQQETLIAVVKGGGTVAPTGIVNFTVGNLTLGAASVDATGVATITVLFNTPTQQVVASYVGDPSYAASHSDATAITAGKPAQFTVDVSVPSVTVVAHQHASVTVTVGSVKGFTDTIALGCLGLPYAATCTFDRSQLKLAADGTVSVQLIIDTGDPLGGGPVATASTGGRSGILACCIPAVLLLAGLSRKVRRSKISLVILLLIGCAAGAGLTGCSGLQVSGTPAGTYTFRVIGTGQGSNTTESQPVTLVVTQ